MRTRALDQPEEATGPPSAVLVRKLAETDDVDLRVSLAALSQLATSQVPLSEMLTHVAEYAVQAIPGADGAGLTLLRAQRPEIIVTSAEFVHQVDEVQYGLDEGPCVTAAKTRSVVRCAALSDDPAWPRFGPRAAALGVESALSLPLATGQEVLAAINIYAHARDAFDDHAEELARLFVGPAAVIVQTAQALAHARLLASQLETALTSRAVIDQAIGVIISRSGCTAQQAFDKLRAISQAENRKLFTVAEEVRDRAMRRARARGR